MASDRGYELLRRIAAGGMGEVFVARRSAAGDFEKRVALKLLLPHLVTPELVARFHAEARLAARMHHPNIVEIFDLGEADGRPFIAMQLVDGVSLARLIKEMKARGVQMPLPLVRLVASGVCEALAYAHGLTDARGRTLGVVHRDVTPSNILVSVAGAVLLTDFGIARVKSDVTEPGVVRGKVAYLAPEQVSHGPVDARSDLWSAAVTLSELLTLHNPFRRDSAGDALEAVRQASLEPLRARRADVTPGFEAALLKALSREPAGRFPNARAFRTALMDGPVATAPELGEWVRALCPSDPLARPELDVAGGTRSVVVVSAELPAAEPSVPLAPPRRERWVYAALAATLVAAGASAWWLVAGGPGGPTAEVEPGPTPEPASVASSTPIGTSQPSPPPVAASTALEVDAGPEPEPVDAGPPLAPAPVVATKPDRSEVPPRRPPRPARRAPAKVEQGVRVGYLSADAVPWAEVLVDGALIDRTPFARFPLPVGRHRVAFRGPSGQVKEKDVVIGENTVEAVRVDFTVQ